MKKVIQAPVILILLFATAFMLNGPVFAQQSVIANKDNTRPGANAQAIDPVAVSSFTGVQQSGYNELSWALFSELNSNKLIVEYSINGVEYQTAGELAAIGTSYQFKHKTTEKESLLYRLKFAQQNGSYAYSKPYMLEGRAETPGMVYPTVVTGNIINLNTAKPLERLQVINSSGTPVFNKELNGQQDFIPVALPSLGAGMYWVVAYGNGWKTTSKIFVPR